MKSKKPSVKLSEALIDLASDYEGATPEQYERAITVAAVVWNFGLLSGNERRARIEALRRDCAKANDFESQSMIAPMLEIRDTKYRDDPRWVVDLKVAFLNGKVSVSVQSGMRLSQ